MIPLPVPVPVLVLLIEGEDDDDDFDMTLENLEVIRLWSNVSDVEIRCPTIMIVSTSIIQSDLWCGLWHVVYDLPLVILDCE